MENGSELEVLTDFVLNDSVFKKKLEVIHVNKELARSSSEMKILFKYFLIVGGFLGVHSLNPYQLYSEGSCGNIHIQPVKNFNRSALDAMEYIAAGSRYALYRIASSHPSYESITPEQLQTEICLQRNITTLRPGTVGTLSGFGRLLLTYDVVPPRSEQSGWYYDGVNPSDTLRMTVLMTDNRNFALLLICWLRTDQVGWGVISRSQSLDRNTRRIVEEQVRNLGFEEKNNIYLSSEGCLRRQGLYKLGYSGWNSKADSKYKQN